MQTEIYQQNPAERTGPAIYDDLERRAELVTHLGLQGQVKLVQVLEKAKQIPFRFLSEEEVRVWRAYLPMRYVDEARWERHSWRVDERLQDYVFDLIPMSVLDLWNDCVLSGYFESYEIWTAESRKDDPLLVGRLGPWTFPIARWGESLQPFETIKGLVQNADEESFRSRRASRTSRFP